MHGRGREVSFVVVDASGVEAHGIDLCVRSMEIMDMRCLISGLGMMSISFI